MRLVGKNLPTARHVRRGPARDDVLPSGVSWAAWSRAWAGVVVVAFVNGALHRGYEGALGELRAEQLSNVVLLMLLAPWVVRTERRHPLPSAGDAVAVGLAWASATVVFEFLFGHYVNGDSWAHLLGAYDVTQGRLWLLTIVGVAAAPCAARAFRLRTRRAAASAGR
jgi:hypothetical protein